MKKIILLLIGLTIVMSVNGQTVKVQGGAAFSKMNSVVFDRVLIGYSIFAGIDYFDKPWFNLSSNVGMIRNGGKYDIAVLNSEEFTGEKITHKETLDYLSINTTFGFKLPKKETSRFTEFVSVGPRFDYLVGNSSYFDTLDDMNPISFGLILGAGVKYDISNFQIGLRADYYLNFTKVTDWSKANDENMGKDSSINTFTVNLTVGYKLNT